MLTRSGERSREAAPQSASASAPISASAKPSTISRSRPGLARSSRLRSQPSMPTVRSTTVLLLRSTLGTAGRENAASWSATSGPAGPPPPARSPHRGTANRQRNSPQRAQTPPAGTPLVDHHEQRSESLPPPEPSRLESDTD